MKVAILDDYFDTLRTLRCFEKLAPFDVTVFNDHIDDVDLLAGRLQDAKELVLIRERTKVSAPLLARLPRLRFISQRSVYVPQIEKFLRAGREADAHPERLRTGAHEPPKTRPGTRPRPVSPTRGSRLSS